MVNKELMDSNSAAADFLTRACNNNRLAKDPEIENKKNVNEYLRK